MSLYRLTATAVDDLAEISAYLTEQGGDSLAFEIENDLFEKFEVLARHPGLGHRRSDLKRILRKRGSTKSSDPKK